MYSEEGGTGDGWGRMGVRVRVRARLGVLCIWTKVGLRDWVTTGLGVCVFGGVLGGVDPGGMGVQVRTRLRVCVLGAVQALGSNALVQTGHCSGPRVRGGGAQGRPGNPAGFCSGPLQSLNQLLEAHSGLFISVMKTAALTIGEAVNPHVIPFYKNVFSNGKSRQLLCVLSGLNDQEWERH